MAQKHEFQVCLGRTGNDGKVIMSSIQKVTVNAATWDDAVFIAKCETGLDAVIVKEW